MEKLDQPFRFTKWGQFDNKINELQKWCFEITSGLKCDNVPFNGIIA